MKFRYGKVIVLVILFIIANLGLKAQAGYGTSHSLGDNVIDSNGSIWVITNSNNQIVKRAYTSAGAFLSYGFNNWGNVYQAGSADLSLPDGGFVPPRDGKIICSDRGSDKDTCYLITNAQKAGFTSESVFKGLGYNFGRATFGDVSWMSSTSLIDSSGQAHRSGTLINDNGTIYLVTQSGLLGISNMRTLNTWGFSLDDVVPTNNFDRSLSKNTLVMPARQPGELSPTVSSSNNAPITITPNPIPLVQTCKVYTYQDKYYYGVGKHCLDKITIKGIYFVAQNQTSGIKSYWKDNIANIFGQMQAFYESQFQNKIKITIDEPALIYGNKNIEDYTAASITEETYSKVSLLNSDSFLILMIYPIMGENNKVTASSFGGGPEHGNGSSATNNYGWIDPAALGTVTTKYGTDFSGYLGSAHEFGHSLGIPHPWEEEVNKDNNGQIINPRYGNDEMGSLMSYGGQAGPLIPESFIRSTVKEKMIAR